MLKKLIRWIKLLFKKDTKRYITHKTADVINKPTKSKKSHEERLKIFKSKLPVKHYPEIVEKYYDRSYDRYMMNKKHKDQKHNLTLQGKSVDDKGNILKVQKPYTKQSFKSFQEYKRYARGFNYNQSDNR